MGKTIKTVRIADLNLNLFVRKALNNDHILYLAELIEDKVKLEPIIVNPAGIVIDGRHRIEAYQLNNVVEIEAEVVNITDEGELIAAAFRANIGGSLPPSHGDIEHTVMIMLDRKVTQKKIVELLELPAEMTRRYIKEVQARLVRQKLQQAADAVTEGGLTVVKAAEQFDVNPDRLKEFLKKKKPEKNALKDIQRNFTKRYRSLVASNAAALRRLFEKFQEGDVSIAFVEAVFDKIEQSQQSSERSISDWKKRFNCANGGSSETPSE